MQDTEGGHPDGDGATAAGEPLTPLEFGARGRPRVAAVSQVLAELPLEAVVDAFVEADLEGIEPTVGPGGHLDAGARREATAIADRIRQSPLQLCGLAVTLGLPLGSDLSAVAELAVEMEAPFIRVFCPVLDQGQPVEQQVDATSEALARLCERAGSSLRILIEPAPGTVAYSLDSARRVLVGADSAQVGMVYDPGSMILEGHLRPSMAMALLGPLVHHVHVKNQRIERTDIGWLTRPTGLLEGLIDWSDALACLEQAGYAQWFSIDHLADHSVHHGGPDARVTELRTHAAQIRTLAFTARGTGPAPPSPLPTRSPQS